MVMMVGYVGYEQQDHDGQYCQHHSEYFAYSACHCYVCGSLLSAELEELPDGSLGNFNGQNRCVVEGTTSIERIVGQFANLSHSLVYALAFF